MKWEYYTVGIIGSAVEVEQKLNEFGEKGWELFEREDNDFLFKRPVPELPSELEEAAENYRRESCNAALKPHIDGPMPEYGGSIKDAFIAGAEYQRKQDQQLIELAEDHAMLAGMNKMKVKMMEKAVDGRVATYDNGRIRIYTELLDGTIGLHFGDKVKVIVIPKKK